MNFLDVIKVYVSRTDPLIPLLKKRDDRFRLSTPIAVFSILSCVSGRNAPGAVCITFG